MIDSSAACAVNESKNESLIVTQGTIYNIAENNSNTAKDGSSSEERSIDSEEATAGRWTNEEHQRFLEAVKVHGRNWKLVQKFVGTRSATQARSHAQKYFAKLEKQDSAKLLASKGSSSGEDASGLKTQSSTPISSPVSRPCLEGLPAVATKPNKRSGRTTKRKLSFKAEEKDEGPSHKTKQVFVCTEEHNVRLSEECKKAAIVPMIQLQHSTEQLVPTLYYPPYLERELPVLHLSNVADSNSLQTPFLMCLHEEQQEQYVSPNAFDFDFGETQVRPPEPLDFSLGPSREEENVTDELSFFVDSSMANIFRPL